MRFIVWPNGRIFQIYQIDQNILLLTLVDV